MPKYVFAYHGGSMPETADAQAAVMAAWGAWFGSLGDAVVDGGNPTGAARTVKADGSSVDGRGTNALPPDRHPTKNYWSTTLVPVERY